MSGRRTLWPWTWRTLAALTLSHASTQAQAAAADAADASIPPSQGPVLAQHGYDALKAGDVRMAAQQFVAALEAGGMEAEQARMVTLSLSDALMSLGHPREALAALSMLKDDRGYDVLSRRAFGLDATGDRRAAAKAYELAAAAAPAPDQRALMTKGQVYAVVAAGDAGPGLTPALDALAGDPGLSAMDCLNLAYAALKLKDDRRALAFFDQADRRSHLDAAASMDAGYAAKRLGQDDVAVRYFRQGLSSAVVGQSPQARDFVRREVSDLSRRWGATASIFYDDTRNRAARLPAAGQGNLQVGGEVYWRPFGWNAGRPVEVFGRAFETLDSRAGDPTGAETLQGWVGVRAKPIATQNVVVEASRLVKLGSRSRDDWMLRASYSTSKGLDQRRAAAEPMFNVFLDGARLFQTKETIGLADARAGYSFRSDAGRLILAPFLGAVASYDSALTGSKTALSAGPGLWTRRWFREDPFKAPQSYVDLSLQYRARLSGSRRGQGFFASFSITY
jgi:adsorption protein A